MGATSGIVGGIYKQSAITSTFTGEAATMSADNKTLIIDDKALEGFKRDASLFTVYKDGVEVTAYEINFDRIIFNEAQTVASVGWTIDGTYCELEQIGGAYEWSIDLKHNVQDKTEFGEAWETKIKGNFAWSASAKRHYIDDDYISIAAAGLPVIVRFFTDIDNADSYVGYAQIDGIKPGTKIDGITDGEISFVGDGHIIWCTDLLVNIP